MRIIGITGGVGCGKTSVLNILKAKCNCEIIVADRLSQDLCMKGNVCYKPLVDLLGEEVLDETGEIDRKAMAARIFNDNSLLESVNGIIHPAVKDYIVDRIESLKREGCIDFLFLEAALLIECGYKAIVDEMWYIYARADVRRQRLKDSRGYSDAKIDSIMASQLSEEEYRNGSDVCIDNSFSEEETYNQIKEYLK